MVDSVLIDADYDGTAFDIDVADVPETKSDLVVGTYELAGHGATVAVKITDMLGEEVLVTLATTVGPPKRRRTKG